MILNSPYISGSLTVTGNTNLMGALTVTGSLAGTATSSSFAYTASSAVSAYTAASAVNATTALTASYATSFTVGGTLTAQTLVVQTITSSTDFVTGSTRFGSLLTNTHEFTGSLRMTGSAINANNSKILIGDDGTFSGNYSTVGFGGTTNGFNRIFASTTTADGLYLLAATSRGVYIRTSGKNASDINIMPNGNTGFGLNFSLPTATLHISGSGSGSLFQVSSTVSSSIFFVSGSGNIGIGTTSPSQKLTLINGTFQIGGTSTFSDNVEIGRVGGDNNMAFATGGSERMRISSAGTASFTANTLTSTADAATINLKQNSTTANTGIYLERSGEQKGYYIYMGGSVDSLTFQRNNAGTKGDVMSLTRDGNVGIGTTSPSTLMHINTARTSGANVDIMTLSDNVTGIQTSGFGVRILATSNNGQAKSAIAFEADGGTNNDTAIVFYTQASAASLDKRMTINKLGNIIIGSDKLFGINTADGTDNGYLALCGAGADGPTRGGHIYLSGNERGSDPGTVVLSAGNVSGGSVIVRTGAGTERMRVTNGGIIYALNSGVDGTYQPMIGGMYTSNNNETNLISTAVSSVAAQSGFRFDVSDGGGSSSRTTSMTINRSSVTIVGSLSKGSGTFKIDHPLESKKDTHHLVHSFIEGPRVDLIYRGKVTLVDGIATINIDESAGMTEGTFATLNRDIQCFTTNESGWDLVKGKVEGNILTITSNNSNSTDEISWMVIGERQDKHIKDTDWTDENGKPILEPLKTI